MSTFAANLKQLPRISHLAALELIAADDTVAARIENRQGQTGSLAVYNHLGQIFGAITADAAKKGVEIFAEHSDDARANPGKHPNIDRLLAMIANGAGMLRVKHHFATSPDDSSAQAAIDTTVAQ